MHIAFENYLRKYYGLRNLGFHYRFLLAVLMFYLKHFNVESCVLWTKDYVEDNVVSALLQGLHIQLSLLLFLRFSPKFNMVPIFHQIFIPCRK